MLLWTWVYKYLFWDPAFKSFGHIPRMGIAGSYGHYVFNFLRNCHTVLHSGCTTLHSYQQHPWFPISPHPCQHFFFIVAILISVRYVVTVLSCISIMINDIEHLLICSLVINIPSLEKCLFKSIFKWNCLLFCCWVWQSVFLDFNFVSPSPLHTLWFIFLILLHWLKLAL